MLRPHAAQRRAAPLAAALVLLAGCGSQAATPTKPPDPAKAKVALLQAPKRAGEIIVRGDLSPASHGPYAFDGRYKVRFEQFAPEDPRVDFTAQTAFVATLDRNAEEDGPGSVSLFHAARRTGSKALTLHGRLFVDVSFGDFPYAIRITPLR
ncbi:MAG TPA: hypothetical protein VF080_10090 [Solirubrobacteraceae bacterium]